MTRPADPFTQMLIDIATAPAKVLRAQEETMAARMSEGLPCRVTADLRQYEREQDELYKQEAAPFDPHDRDLMHDVCGNYEWADAIAPLLISLENIENTQESFGVDAQKALDEVLPQLKALRATVLKLYETL